MAWTTPITWASNSTLTSAQMNQQVRDNMNFVFNGKVVAPLYYTGAASYTTASTTFVDVDATHLILTQNITSGNVCVTANFSTSNSLAAGKVYCDIIVDGTTRAGGTNGSSSNVGLTVQGDSTTLVCYFTGLSVASHTFKLQWRVSSGTGTMYSTAADTIFMAVEEL